MLFTNVPSHYCQERLLCELDALGLGTLCNFVYLPQLPGDGDSRWNVGCAYVNFCTVEDTEHARRALVGHEWLDTCSGERKQVHVMDAVIQGFKSNVQHYSLNAASELAWVWHSGDGQTELGPMHMGCGELESSPSQATTCLASPASLGSLGSAPSSPLTMQPDEVPEAVSRTPSPSPERRFDPWGAMVGANPLGHLVAHDAREFCVGLQLNAPIHDEVLDGHSVRTGGLSPEAGRGRSEPPLGLEWPALGGRQPQRRRPSRPRHGAGAAGARAADPAVGS